MALGIATVYQNLALVDTRSAAQNVFMGREPTRWLMVDRRRMERETAEVLSTLVSKSFPVTALVGELSGGQRQAVAVSRAVHEQKKVILLDEPTAALGVQESHHVLDSILELKRQGKSLVVISHNLLHVFRVADRITVFRGGRVASTHLKDETTPDEIVTKITGADVL